MTAATRIMARPVPLEERACDVTVMVNGERLVCDWSGCLYWPDSNTLIVSDLHLEKGSSLASRGVLLPPYDTAVTLARLAARIAHWQPECVIALGDSFHDREASARLCGADLRALSAVMAGRDWIWITGNHDPEPPLHLGGRTALEFIAGGLTFRHEPRKGSQPGEIAGHLHPAGKIARRAKSVRRPCFATDGTRMILPAFGAYAGGLNVRDTAFDGLFDERTLSAVLLGRERVFHIAGRHLIG